MRSTSRAVAGVLVFVISALATAGITTAAAPVPDRLRACAEAWSLIARESSALGAGDAAAWRRVSDGFLSLSDATFDGPLSNAFGSVSASSDEYSLALGAGAGGDTGRASFDSSLADLGGVCARLSVTNHKVTTVPRFDGFRYQSGVLTGLDPSASRISNAAILRMVRRTVAGARQPSGSPCMAGATSCGSFVQRLTQRPCIAGLVCIAQAVGLLSVGTNDGQAAVTTLVLNGWTGRAIPLATVLPSADAAQFVTGVNVAVQAKLAAGGLANDPAWDTDVAFDDIDAWLPQPDGIHVWFDTFAVAPGSFGVVHVVVPTPGRATSAGG